MEVVMDEEDTEEVDMGDTDMANRPPHNEIESFHSLVYTPHVHKKIPFNKILSILKTYTKRFDSFSS